MRKIFLITGFNNWGKTWLLTRLFGTKVFYKSEQQYYAGCPFLVMPQSNDDLGKKVYIRKFNERLEEFESANGDPRYIASAFCPTKEPKNNSIEIIRELFQNDIIYMLLLERKWCGHANLQVAEIQSFYANQHPSLTTHTIAGTPLDQVRTFFSANLP